MRYFILIVLMLGFGLEMMGQGQRPDMFPVDSVPNLATDAFYTQEGGVPRKIYLNTLANLFGVVANNVPIGYVPSPTGNNSNLNEVVVDSNGDVWYIDGNGNGVLIGDNSNNHVAVTINGMSNPALSSSGVVGQVLNLDLDAGGSYDNSSSGLAANSIQDAIDNLATLLSNVQTYDDEGDGVLIINDGTNQPFTIDVAALAGDPVFQAALFPVLPTHLDTQHIQPAGFDPDHQHNGVFTRRGVINNVNEFRIVKADGTVMLSVDF